MIDAAIASPSVPNLVSLSQRRLQGFDLILILAVAFARLIFAFFGGAVASAVSFWPSILVHFVNNSLFVFSAYHPGGG